VPSPPESREKKERAESRRERPSSLLEPEKEEAGDSMGPKGPPQSCLSIWGGEDRKKEKEE